MVLLLYLIIYRYTSAVYELVQRWPHYNVGEGVPAVEADDSRRTRFDALAMGPSARYFESREFADPLPKLSKML